MEFPLGSRAGAPRGEARQNSGGAKKYVTAAKAILDKGTNPEQQEYFPYLAGYVAFYSGDYPEALRNLKEAAIADPFIQCLTAQVYEKMGDAENAQIYYRRAASTTAHSVPAAYARPFATRKLGSRSMLQPVRASDGSAPRLSGASRRSLGLCNNPARNL